jgi:hypothetical protein
VPKAWGHLYVDAGRSSRQVLDIFAGLLAAAGLLFE